MRAQRLVLLLTLVLPTLAQAQDQTPRKTPNFVFHQIEGPFATLDEYCARFEWVAGTCVIEAAPVPTPDPFDDFHSIRFARVHSHGKMLLDWLVLVVATDKGLFVDDRLMQRYNPLFKGGDAKLVSVEKSPKKSGAWLEVRLSGHTGTPLVSQEDRAPFVRADGSYDELTICASDAGTIRCMDPGVVDPH
jgi:hypothetical protein